ncbi:hypothetical protein HS041_21340 [Planomonospora sp. ID67723]|uniref:hypothetical protein n=1 Tax=Planomonospora sp. ID67723 TaxID=2738134 RepID=UPI0018C39375|nr:hypothetical protein [Planomonospora sp. ID67723]MBG0830313.1 hypothetical protein [Planomonospora sp. ID67723]
MHEGEPRAAALVDPGGLSLAAISEIDSVPLRKILEEWVAAPGRTSAPCAKFDSSI